MPTCYAKKATSFESLRPRCRTPLLKQFAPFRLPYPQRRAPTPLNTEQGHEGLFRMKPGRIALGRDIWSVVISMSCGEVIWLYFR